MGETGFFLVWTYSYDYKKYLLLLWGWFNNIGLFNEYFISYGTIAYIDDARAVFRNYNLLTTLKVLPALLGV